MSVRASLYIAALVLWTLFRSMPDGYCAEPARVLISDIKAHPNRYEGRVVELLGILDSGHLGVFLRSKTSDDLIRLRLVPAEQSGGEPVVKDSLFSQLRELAAKTELPGDPEQKFEVLMVGRVRVLKNGAKPRKKYYPQIESPVEVTPIRVLSIAKVGAAR